MKYVGPGKYHPGGPTCNLNGAAVECLTFSSKSGGITVKILVQILSYFDQKDLLPQIPGGPVSFLLLDGHNTSLDPLFIDYINDSGHHLEDLFWSTVHDITMAGWGLSRKQWHF